MLETFYATTAQISFALLGLWWVVVQFKHDLFMRDLQRRRTAYNISLYFILPGAMSLLALLASEVTLVWQIAFIIAGILGIIETVQLMRQSTPTAISPLTRIAHPATLLLYGVIVVFAIAPGILRAFGITPLEVEAILMVLVIFLGIQMAWEFFAQARGE